MMKIYCLIRAKVKNQGDFTQVYNEIKEAHSQFISNIEVLVPNQRLRGDEASLEIKEETKFGE